MALVQTTTFRFDAILFHFTSDGHVVAGSGKWTEFMASCCAIESLGAAGGDPVVGFNHDRACAVEPKVAIGRLQVIHLGPFNIELKQVDYCFA